MRCQRRILIALSGKSGCGKTELANHLARHLRLQRCSTGDLYRQIAALLFGSIAKESMNELTRALRAMDPNCVLTAALRSSDPAKGIVFDSMRFKEDYQFFQERGFLLVRIYSRADVRHRRMRNRGERFDALRLEQDQTETALDGMPFDLIIANEGEDVTHFLEEAKKMIAATLEEL